MIKLYIKENILNPYSGHTEATQKDIDQWNLDRGGVKVYFNMNDGHPEDIDFEKFSRDTHTAVMSAPKLIEVEKPLEGEELAQMLKDIDDPDLLYQLIGSVAEAIVKERNRE
jgi:hypothetical protein